MNITRWDPFSSIDEIFGRWPRLRLPKSMEGQLDWSPSANISETDGEVWVHHGFDDAIT
jgi:hypothetical protein